MTELEERARRMLEVARSQHAPSAADAARVRSALRARVAAEPRLLEQPMRAALTRALPGKLLVAFGAGGLAGFAAGVYVALAMVPAPLSLPSEPAPRSVPAAAEPAVARAAETTVPSEPARSETTPTATNALPAVAPPEAAALPAPRAKPPAPTTSVASRLKAELDGLRRAQELLHQGQPAWAIARLTELDRAEVGSVLLEERTATRAIAECMLGQDAQAQTEEFSRRFPKSAHLERVRSSCAKVAQSGSPASNIALPQTETGRPRHE